MAVALPFFLLIGLNFNFHLWAQTNSASDPCDFEVITNSCKVFDPEGPEKMTLPDGSTLFNLVALVRSSNDKLSKSELERKVAVEEKNSPEFLRLRQKLHQLLEEISSEKMHPRFRYYITNNFTEFIEVLFDPKKSIKNEIELPWPPANPKDNQMVSRKEVVSKLGALFQREQSEQLQTIYDEMKMLQVAARNLHAFVANKELLKKLPSGKQVLATKYFEFAKLRVLSLIKNGANDNQLSVAEKSLARKVSSVRLRSFDPQSELDEQNCTYGLPNAFYRAHDHTVTLCPAAYFLSDAAIIQVVSHEIGHSIAPCISQFGTFEIVSSKLISASQKLKGGFSQELNGDPHKRKIFLELLAINKTSNTTALPFPLLASEEALQYFIKNEIIKPEIPGVSQDEYPFRQVSQCLADKHGFRGVDRTELRRVASEVVKARLEYREPDYDANRDERQIIDAISKYPGCLSPSHRESQADEAMADWISSQVLADYLSGNPLKTPDERLGMVSVFAGLVCKQRYEAQREPNDTVATIFKSFMKDSLTSAESHPPSKRRIEKIIFGHPEIRKAAGCLPIKNLACQR